MGHGYNSQFDVEGRVDQVSEFLDRDVDFDKWLKDIPDDDEVPNGTQDPPSQSQNGSQNQKSELGMNY